jgi:hypothetical protein
MVSYHGYWEYNDLVQTYDLTDKKRFPPKEQPYNKNTIMGFLSNNKDYSIMEYIVKTSKTDRKMDDSQFNSTVFVCSDLNFRKMYNDNFAMKLDRNSSTSIINYSTIIRFLGLDSLKTRAACKIDTKDRSNNINIIHKNISGEIFANGYKILGEQKCSNGNIIFIEGLLLPPTFVNNCC